MAAGLAVALARDGMPFRKATRRGRARRRRAEERPLAEGGGEGDARVRFAQVAARLDVLFDPLEAVKAKSLVGGAAPDAVRASLEAALARGSARGLSGA